MKQKHSLALEGKNKNSEVPILNFKAVNDKVLVTIYKDEGKALLQTAKGKYRLLKHDTLNIYQGVINDIKVHITHKAWVGQLIYWA